MAHWKLFRDVPGVGQAGDVLIHDPEHPNPDARLYVVKVLGNGDDLDTYLDAIRRVQGHVGLGSGSDGPNQPRRPLQLVGD